MTGQLKLDLVLRMDGEFIYIYIHIHMHDTRHFRKSRVNAVSVEQVQVLSCPAAVAQPAEQKRRIPFRMIRGNKSVGEGSSLGLLEGFSIPPAF